MCTVQCTHACVRVFWCVRENIIKLFVRWAADDILAVLLTILNSVCLCVRLVFLVFYRILPAMPSYCRRCLRNIYIVSDQKNIMYLGMFFDIG